MRAPRPLTDPYLQSFLQEQNGKSFLRFATCGSVDDGKSTLIGRLLVDAQAVFEDQLDEVKQGSGDLEGQSSGTDYALLVDGLKAEREQGITIDVAYRYFTTRRRKFIIADVPGHQQYTRNFATGLSTANLAVLLVDARNGVLEQTRRHALIASLLRVPELVVCINKMDLVGYSEDAFEQIRLDVEELISELVFSGVSCLPVSALKGDMIVSRGNSLGWYGGPTLLERLEEAKPETISQKLPFRFPVQRVSRSEGFRGYSGRVVSGTVRSGDPVRVLPANTETHVRSIITPGGETDTATSGQSITLTFTSELDVSRGDVVAANGAPPDVSDQFQANLIWLGDEPMLPGRSYLMKIGAQSAICTPAQPKYAININTYGQFPARTLKLNEIGVCNIALDRAVTFDAYGDNRPMGAFILIDRLSNETVGMGMLNFALRRASNIRRQVMSVGKKERADQKQQRPVILWLTGLSGAGKSTIADEVSRRTLRHELSCDDA